MNTTAGTYLRNASATLLLVTAFVVLQSAPTAGLQAGEPSEVMKQFLESSPPAAGAHGQSDPHAGLSAEKMAQVALAHLDESRTQLAFQTLDTAIARYPENAMLLSIRASMLLQGQRTRWRSTRMTPCC
jgi:hypothetical protein